MTNLLLYSICLDCQSNFTLNMEIIENKRNHFLSVSPNHKSVESVMNPGSTSLAIIRGSSSGFFPQIHGVSRINLNDFPVTHLIESLTAVAVSIADSRHGVSIHDQSYITGRILKKTNLFQQQAFQIRLSTLLGHKGSKR